MVEGQIRDPRTTGRGAEDRPSASRIQSCMVVRHASWLLHRCRVKLDGYTPYRAISGRPHGGEVDQLGEQVHWKVQGMMHQKFEDQCRGTWFDKAERSLTSSQVPTGVRIARSVQRRLFQDRWKLAESEGFGWHPVGDDAKENQTDGAEVSLMNITWAMVQKHGPCPRCKFCHSLPGEHSQRTR